MNCENAKVVSIESENVWLESIQQSACTACSAKSACGQGLLNSIFQSKRHYFKVSTQGFSEPLQINDEVEISVDEHVLAFGALSVYGLPLFFMLMGAFGAYQINAESDLVTGLGALVGFVLGFFGVYIFSHLNQSNPKYHPRLTRVIQHNDLLTEQVIVNSL